MILFFGRAHGWKQMASWIKKTIFALGLRIDLGNRLNSLSSWQHGCTKDNVLVSSVSQLEAQAKTLLIILKAACCRMDIIALLGPPSGSELKLSTASLLSPSHQWRDGDKNLTGQTRPKKNTPKSFGRQQIQRGPKCKNNLSQIFRRNDKIQRFHNGFARFLQMVPKKSKHTKKPRRKKHKAVTLSKLFQTFFNPP